MNPRWRSRIVPGTLLASAFLTMGSAASAQLRPYDSFAWDTFDGSTRITAHAGVDLLWDQRASLAGTEGRLLQVGDFQAVLRSGRIGLEVAGTIHRYFREDDVFSTAMDDVRPSDGTRDDWGDFLLATTVLLTPPRRPVIAVVRFGTRLPTTNNEIGLERDRTDFFGLVGGRADAGPLRVTAEVGIGINGTREPEYEQSDMLVYALGIQLPRGWIRPSVLLIGHADGLPDRTIRGNEELAELRFGLRTSGRYWIQIQAIRGLTDFSPRSGVSLSLGVTR